MHQFLLFAVGLFLFGVSEQAAEDQCQPIPHDCSFYERCLEAKVPCGPTGYALQSGKPICTKFIANINNFSAEGQDWAWATLSCLQTKLVPVANGDVKMNCAELKTFAYETHAPCYTESGVGVCNLPPQDLVQLFKIIGADFVNIDAMKMGVQILSTCSTDNYNTAKNIIMVSDLTGLYAKILFAELANGNLLG